MNERWAAEIRDRTRRRWPAERQRRELGDRELVLPLVQAAPLLRALNLLDGRGEMSRDAVRKFVQINHLVKLLEPTVRDLIDAHDEVRVLDVACGSSFLTLALAWCFEFRWRHRCRIVGVDRNAAVIERSGERAELAGLHDRLTFETGIIGDLDPADLGPVHALVALHACDTASDEALALGVTSQADVIAVAPCCQAELAAGWAALARDELPGAFAPIWSSPHLRREAAATMTDGLRALLLRACGYQVTAMEFVPSAHTPKNTLLRARRTDGDQSPSMRDYTDLKAALGGFPIRLEVLLVDAGHLETPTAEGEDTPGRGGVPCD